MPLQTESLRLLVGLSADLYARDDSEAEEARAEVWDVLDAMDEVDLKRELVGLALQHLYVAGRLRRCEEQNLVAGAEALTARSA